MISVTRVFPAEIRYFGLFPQSSKQGVCVWETGRKYYIYLQNYLMFFWNVNINLDLQRLPSSGAGNQNTNVLLFQKNSLACIDYFSLDCDCLLSLDKYNIEYN